MAFKLFYYDYFTLFAKYLYKIIAKSQWRLLNDTEVMTLDK